MDDFNSNNENINQENNKIKKTSLSNKIKYTILALSTIFVLDYFNLPSKGIKGYNNIKSIFYNSDKSLNNKETIRLYNSVNNNYSRLPLSMQEDIALTYISDSSVNISNLVKNIPDHKLDSIVPYLSRHEKMDKERKTANFIKFYNELADQYGNWEMVKQVTKQELKR